MASYPPPNKTSSKMLIEFSKALNYAFRELDKPGMGQPGESIRKALHIISSGVA